METKPSFFHHPDISYTVLRRKSVDVFMDMVFCYAGLLASRGYADITGECFPTDTARSSALCRLRKAGLITHYKGRGKGVGVTLTDKGTLSRRSLAPEKMWNRKWDGLWRVLLYDVPESDSAFRHSLRRFLRRLRMGCLQKSVYVSPHDIRPEYHDLVKGLHVDFYSYLFEARTVLGRGKGDLIRDAWDFERLSTAHAWFLEACRGDLDRIRSGTMDKDSLFIMIREELSAYLTVMEDDPLLPRSLHPSSYLGRRVFAMHRQFTSLAGKQLKDLS